MSSDDLDVEPAIGKGLDGDNLDQRAQRVQRLGAAVADFVALPDRGDPEDAIGGILDREQVPHQSAVALFEDVQTGGDTGENHGVQRKHRHVLAHAANLAADRETRGRQAMGNLRIGP